MEKKFVQIVTMISLGKNEIPADIVYIEGIRYERETETTRKHREDYEPGGKFEHLKGVKDH
jgi:hypothetical protein